MKICYIGGGSRNWAWTLMQDLCFEREMDGVIELYDIKPQDAETNALIGNRLTETAQVNWRFHANPSLAAAMEGSDFVFVSILPADFAEMAVDVHAPEKYGIWQSVGDTAGPGGLMRALRTIPQFRELARVIEYYAPNAWVINYTNPMSICTRTLYREFPEIKAFGCCHEVFNTQKLLATIAEDAGLAAPGSIKREQINTRVLGINHFTWFDKASWKNIDLFPYYRDFAEKYKDTGFKKPSEGPVSPEKAEHDRYFASLEKVKIDLFLRYGLIAAAGDRHLAEFCPHSWYLASPKQVESWGFALTPVSWRIKNRERLLGLAAAYREGTATMVPQCSGEEGLRIMKALLGLGPLVTNVNLPNVGQLPGLPSEAVVETNAYFTRDNIQPLVNPAGLPTELNALVLHHLEAQEGLIEAAFEYDKEKAFRIFSQDLAIQNLSLSEARTLFDEMCEGTGVKWLET